MSSASTARTETPGIDQANERILTIAMVDRLRRQTDASFRLRVIEDVLRTASLLPSDVALLTIASNVSHPREGRTLPFDPAEPGKGNVVAKYL